MITAVLLVVAANIDAYDVVLEAEDAARRCEVSYVGDAWLASSRSMEELLADARQACSSTWDEYRKARLAYHAKHRCSISSQVPGFRPELDICWQAFETERNRWPGMPENIARRDCKNAQN
jgi:hypothetical protein